MNKLIGTFRCTETQAFIKECGYEDTVPRYPHNVAMLADGARYTVEATEGGDLYRIYSNSACAECGKEQYLDKGVCRKCWNDIQQERWRE